MRNPAAHQNSTLTYLYAKDPVEDVSTLHSSAAVLLLLL